MGTPGVAMGAEHHRGEGQPLEKQGTGWGTWRGKNWTWGPSTPTAFTPSKDQVQVTPVGHAQPPRCSRHTLIPLEARVSHRVPKGCREEERQGAPDRVGAPEWCRGCVMPCLCPLSLI